MVKVRTMIIGVGLTQELWENVVDTTCYLVNSSSPMALVNKIPYEACASKNPSLTHIRLFGCHSFVHVPKEKITKINSKSEKCIFIWYMDRVKGYKLQKLVMRKEVHGRHMIFIELKTMKGKKSLKEKNHKRKNLKWMKKFQIQQTRVSRSKIWNKKLQMSRLWWSKNKIERYIPPKFQFVFCFLYHKGRFQVDKVMH